MHDQVAACAEILKSNFGLDIPNVFAREEIPGIQTKGAESRQATEQSARFVAEYALARLLISFGIQPAAMIGYGTGELTAACLAGVFSLDEALLLATYRDNPPIG